MVYANPGLRTSVLRPGFSHRRYYRNKTGASGQLQKTGAKTSFTPAWWRRVDSNHRSETQQIYSLPPLATRELLHIPFYKPQEAAGAGGRIRTPDLLITNQLLYRLSYTSA